MRLWICALSLGVLSSQAPLHAPGDRVVDARRLDELGAAEFPGVAYAVVEQSEVVELGAAGVKRLGGDDPISPETPFLIGSISKSFTALGVMQLVETGELSLEDPIASHLPAFADQPSGAITIRQLLSHTSGYSTYQGNPSGAGAASGADAIARRTDWLASKAPAYAPGARWEYSNANYVILGRLIEVVSGLAYPTYIESHVLQPAGMLDSFASDGQRHAAMATGHTPWFGTKRPLLDTTTNLGTGPQGGIVSSASDLARYMRLMMNGEDDLVSAETKAAMMSPASDASPFYGLGWFVDRELGTVWHSGVTPGVETLLTLLPAQSKGVVVLVNAGSGVGFGETARLRDGITSSSLGLGDTGEASRLWPKATFIALTLLPFVFLLCMLWAWRHRVALRTKSGPLGVFSLWFPLLTTTASAWVLVSLVPHLFGVPLGTLRRFQPDLVLAMTALAVTGLLWAVFRLGVAYSGRPQASK